MASSGNSKAQTRRRILANVQDRKKGNLPEAPPEEDTTVASRAEDAKRVLSQPVKAGRRKKRGKPKGKSATQVGLLGAIVVGGIAAIIGLRYLAEAFGVNWIGD